MSSDTIYDPIVSDVSDSKRREVQEEFGRHLVEQRNRVAALVRRWIENDVSFPVPIYDRLLDRVRSLDAATRSDIASISLLMADQILAGVLSTLDCSDEVRSGSMVVNYAVIAQMRHPDSDDVVEQVDVNRGKPVVAVSNSYKRWLSRYAPSELRPATRPRGSPQT